MPILRRYCNCPLDRNRMSSNYQTQKKGALIVSDLRVDDFGYLCIHLTPITASNAYSLPHHFQLVTSEKRIIFLPFSAMLIYRVFHKCPKLPLKAVHGVLMILGLLFSVVGLKAAFDSHNLRGIPDMYSIHSWIGLVTVILFAVQVRYEALHG
ncbi:unnamed protein product [Hydatigera taeniaeformis]|uniref:Cytochrome b561 domain-containing protein n=1 Tax=Hydatigena taeniaeformis TaxID=6205 RepID=A0A0R3XB35_HYDTA|nr:unnamed protein product [Hydatigera taeniaeformis]